MASRFAIAIQKQVQPDQVARQQNARERGHLAQALDRSVYQLAAQLVIGGGANRFRLVPHANVEQVVGADARRLRRLLNLRLDTLGLVRRETDPGDSRAKLAFITEAARPIVDEMKRIATEVYDKALAGIDGGDRETLMKALCRIAANLDAGSTAQKEEELS